MTTPKAETMRVFVEPTQREKIKAELALEVMEEFVVALTRAIAALREVEALRARSDFVFASSLDLLRVLTEREMKYLTDRLAPEVESRGDEPNGATSRAEESAMDKGGIRHDADTTRLGATPDSSEPSDVR